MSRVDQPRAQHRVGERLIDDAGLPQILKRPDAGDPPTRHRDSRGVGLTGILVMTLRAGKTMVASGMVVSFGLVESVQPSSRFGTANNASMLSACRRLKSGRPSAFTSVEITR